MQYRKRCRRYDSEQDAHFLTFSCYHRLPLFTRQRTCNWMLEALQLGREKHEFDLWAYVVMPEHVHVLIWPMPDVRIAQILTTLKQSVSKRALLWLSDNAPEFLHRLESHQAGRTVRHFWQRGGGYDRNLRSAADVHEKVEYIHTNPVRRGLVNAPDEWAWSSARAWQTGVDEPIAIDRESFTALHV